MDISKVRTYSILINTVLIGLTLKVRVDLRGNVPLRGVEGFDFYKFYYFLSVEFF